MNVTDTASSTEPAAPSRLPSVRPLRVGLFTPSYPGVTGEGGIGTYTRHLAHGLTERGHSVHVLTPGVADDEASDAGVRVHLIRTAHLPVVDRFFPGAGACYRVGRAVRRVVTRHRLDLVEFPNWEGLGVLYCWARQVPVVVRLHTSSLQTQRIHGSAGRAVRWDVRRERYLARAADTLVTHSDAHRATMAEELTVEQSRIHVIPHGVPLAPALPPEPRAGDDFTVVYLGRLEKRKGTVDVLRAVPTILREVPDVRFVLIGTDRPDCPGARTHARFVQEELPAEARSRVHLLGRLPDDEVDRWLRRADLFVAPSVYESFGLIFLEAMRWGTPVVGTTAGGIPEVVEDGKSGLLVPPSDPPALARAVATLLRDGERRRELGAAGRRRVEQQFSTQMMTERVEALYRRTVRRAPRGESPRP